MEPDLYLISMQTVLYLVYPAALSVEIERGHELKQVWIVSEVLQIFAVKYHIQITEHLVSFRCIRQPNQKNQWTLSARLQQTEA